MLLCSLTGACLARHVLRWHGLKFTDSTLHALFLGGIWRIMQSKHEGGIVTKFTMMPSITCIQPCQLLSQLPWDPYQPP